jgi:hypothetical protein
MVAFEKIPIEASLCPAFMSGARRALQPGRRSLPASFRRAVAVIPHCTLLVNHGVERRRPADARIARGDPRVALAAGTLAAANRRNVDSLFTLSGQLFQCAWGVKL